VLVRCDDGQEVPEKESYRRLRSAVGIVYGRLDRVGGATRSLGLGDGHHAPAVTAGTVQRRQPAYGAS